MAELIPQTFVTNPEAAIASYNFFDIQEGTGVIIFQGLKVATGAAAFEYRLTTDTTLFSEGDGQTSINGADIDFDLEFNRPQNVKGILYLAVPINAFATTGTVDVNITGTIIHYDGSTETTIGTAITSPDLSQNSAAHTSKMTILKWDLAKRHFKIGEILRINITGTLTGNGTGQIGHSPVGTQKAGSGQEFENIGTSRLSVYVPFEVDL